MKTENLVKTFNGTGVCEVHVDKVIKVWSDRFVISQWKDEFRLIKSRKNSEMTYLKIGISKEQALEIIKALKLIQIQSAVFNSGSSWHTKQFVKSELARFREIQKKKEEEYTTVTRIIDRYAESLN